MVKTKYNAKWLILLNLTILVVVLTGINGCSMKRMIDKETKAILSKTGNSQTGVVSVRDIDPLPLPVQRWMQVSGVIGKQKITHLYQNDGGSIFFGENLKYSSSIKPFLSTI